MTRTSILIFAMLFSTTGMSAEPSVGERTVLALIVTNNRSIQLARPDLRYADDDGAKYYEFFRMLAEPEGISLLTEFDTDTARLFSKLVPVAESPTKKNLSIAIARLAARSRAALNAGRVVEFYFIFAGHGDIDRGQGFIELRDGSFTADDLERLLTTVPSTHSHVILDSCNSFFVINPRKPGGRRFATPQDAAQLLSRRLPNVGVFLSTSSEGEVFEWSEIQSGIFSHAVRSGIAGAADANGDGQISYEELAAFVSVAAAEVRNPLYRPAVFARGPGGHGQSPLIQLAGARAALLELKADGPERVTLRDSDDLPWIDVHREPHASIVLRMPDRLAEGLVVEEREQHGNESRVVRTRRGAVEGGLPIALAELHEVPADHHARGLQDLFHLLFVLPFGPKAYSAYEASGAMESPQIFGVSQDDIDRMRLLLKQTAALDRARRFTMGSIGVVLGATMIATGIPAAVRHEDASNWAGYFGVGALFAGLAMPAMLRPSQGERLYRDFGEQLSRPNVNTPLVVAALDVRLSELYRAERTNRILLGVTGGIALFGGIALIIANETAWRNDGLSTAAPVLSLFGAPYFVSSFFDTPIQRMVRLWREDPGMSRRVQPSVSVLKGGAALSVASSF